MPGPLAGLKVLDLSRFVAGPYCAMQLGDLGAEVVKVEKPETGEEIRTIEPTMGGDSLFVMMFNRNKKSLGLKLSDPRGQEILRELVAEADILVENFRPGVMEARGMGWDTLSAINPRLIMARISGYGQDGPHSQRACFDAIAQAESGIMHITGQPDGPPTIAGTTIIDHTTGMHALIGILAALHARDQNGRGQLVDCALLDSALAMLMTVLPEHKLFGREFGRTGNRDRYGAPANSFPTADGRWVHLVAGGDPRFGRFVKATGMEHLLNDPRFVDNSHRKANVEPLEAEITTWTKSKTADEIIELLNDAGVPCGKVSDFDDVLQNPQLAHRDQIVEVEHPKAGKVPMQGFVTKLSDTPASIREPVPTPGQHSADILRGWLGYDDDRITALTDSGIL